VKSCFLGIKILNPAQRLKKLGRLGYGRREPWCTGCRRRRSRRGNAPQGLGFRWGTILTCAGEIVAVSVLEILCVSNPGSIEVKETRQGTLIRESGFNFRVNGDQIDCVAFERYLDGWHDRRRRINMEDENCEGKKR